MAKYERVNYPDGHIILIGRVPRSRLGAMEALFHILHERWSECQRFTEIMVNDAPTFAIFQTIANLFPRYDKPGEWGFDVQPLRKDLNQLEELFLFQIDIANETQACKLIALHHYQPVPRSQADIHEAADLAIPSSGDGDMDLLAQLAVGFERFSEALDIWNTLDAESIDRFLYYANGLRRDPEERKNEALAEDFAAWKVEHEEDYREALGIKMQIPKADKEGILSSNLEE